jgi:phage terminase small subunit
LKTALLTFRALPSVALLRFQHKTSIIQRRIRPAAPGHVGLECRMPAPMTEMQERFAVEYATNGGNATKAALAAGYSEKSASELGHRLTALPHVQHAILSELFRQRSRSGAVGLKAMIEIATSEKIPGAARVSAARALMEHAGLIGTAKDVKEERAKADKKNVVDYNAVLASLGKSTTGAAA